MQKDLIFSRHLDAGSGRKNIRSFCGPLRAPSLFAFRRRRAQLIHFSLKCPHAAYPSLVMVPAQAESGRVNYSP